VALLVLLVANTGTSACDRLSKEGVAEEVVATGRLFIPLLIGTGGATWAPRAPRW